MYLVCLSSVICLRVFLCIIFRRGFLLGRQPCRPIWCSVRHTLWVLTDPLPFSNAGSTHTSISQTQPLDMTRSTCPSTSLVDHGKACCHGTCPVKLLYGLGHCAAAQFQDLGNILIAYASGSQFQSLLLYKLYTCTKCHFFSVVTWKDIMKYFQ